MKNWMSFSYYIEETTSNAEMRMMIFLPNLLLAIVSIQPSVPQPHDPLPSNWFSILKHLHSTACIPVGYECTPPHDGTFPWDTGESFPSQRLVRRPREVFEHPLAVKRNPGVCCGFCSCETDCLNHASCCLSMYESLSHARRETSKTKYSCVKPELRYGKRTKKVTPIWMVTKCDSNHTLKDFCENSRTDETFESLIPVSVGSVTYRNHFCVTCNGIFGEDMDSWNIEFQCRTILQLPDENLLQTIKEKQCNINFIKPANTPVDECEIVPYVTSECNVTGKWQEYDLMIDAGCQSFIDPFNLTYANVFCYLCNTERSDQSEPSICNFPSQEIFSDVSPPFSAILTLDAIMSMTKLDTSVDTLQCNKTRQFKDEKMMKCRDILCAENRELVENYCRIRPSQNNPACYYVLIKMTYIGFDVLDKVSGDAFFKALEDRLAGLIEGFYDEAISIDMFIKTKPLPHQPVEYIFLRILIEKSGGEHDIQNATVYNVHNRKIDINLKWFLAELVLYNVTAQGQEIKDKDGEEEIFISVPKPNKASPDILKLSQTKRVGNKSDSFCSTEEVKPFKIVDLCPHVRTSFDEMPVAIGDDLLYAPGNLTLSLWEYAIRGKDILICLDAFEILYEKLEKRVAENDQPRATKNDRVHPKHLLSLVCVCVSIVCLLITIATISTFPELHSQPGMNNIILCTCLLLAQLFYQFGAGQSSLKSWACALIGGICHFLWLSVMFSMNVCCVQMFRIFKSPTKLKSRFALKLTLKYLTYISGSSVFLVTVNLVVSLGTSNGMASGYGGKLCYISSPMMHLYTFVIPFAFTIIVNLVLFGFVILKINRANIASRDLHGERNYFGAYVRLSTLTGLTWIFGYLFIILKNETLEYLFIICNASQGLFIMVAFIVNKRIYKLVRRRRGIANTESTNDG